MSSDIRDVSLCFEAVKVSINQNKQGVILRLAIHPEDVPMALIKDWVGSQYMVAMTKMDEDSQPIGSDELISANRAIKSAGMLPRNPQFQRFIQEKVNDDMGFDEDNPENSCIQAIRMYCGVQSRTEFRENSDALEKFKKLKAWFEDWVGL